MNINTQLINQSNKPSFNYKNISTSVKSKTTYINQIMDNIEFKEDIDLFEKILENFVEHTAKFKYGDFNKWFNYDRYESYMKDNRVKVQIWINNLIRISRHRNFKLFGIASDTQSLEEIKQIFYYTKRTSYDYKYISINQIKNISSVGTSRKNDVIKDDKEKLLEGNNKILNQLKYDMLCDKYDAKKEILKARILDCLKYKTTRLNLSNLNLVKWPNEILQELSHIEELDLSINKISEIPNGAIKKLKNLKVLNLDDNSIKKIFPYTWEELKKLPNLRKLYINHRIPESFTESFTKLEVIIIKDFHVERKMNYAQRINEFIEFKKSESNIREEKINTSNNNMEILREEKI